MKQNKNYIDIIVEKKGLVTFLYVGVMSLIYLTYILLENYRLYKSEYWTTLEYKTDEDIQSIQELGAWISAVELLFLGLFVLAAILVYRFSKNKKSNYFITLNLCLFVALFGIGYVLSFFLLAPIGNLTQALILPTFLLIIFAAYVVIVRFRRRSVN